MATDVPRVYKLYQYGSEKYYNLRSWRLLLIIWN
jgi:hypothetical protein